MGQNEKRKIQKNTIQIYIRQLIVNFKIVFIPQLKYRDSIVWL